MIINLLTFLPTYPRKMIKKVYRFIIRQIVIIMLLFSIVFLLYIVSSSNYGEDMIDSNIGRTNDEINNLIRMHNLENTALNTDDFGSIKPDTTILVILLNKFTDHVKILIESLSQVTGIEEVLIIFSHSHYDENLNRIIKNIDFCRVLQFFYPYSIQTHPSVFPGSDQSDCLYGMFRKRSKNKNCTKVLLPEAKSYFRVPWQAEKKHHWWWTANTIFEEFLFTLNHRGIVIFLDNDSLFMKDFVYMATYMKHLADFLPQCDFLTFGTSSYSDSNPKSFYKVEHTYWDPRKHGDILALDTAAWNSIASHYDLYCTFDDTSWIRSLYYISSNRRDGNRFKTLTCGTPRVYQFHNCYYPNFYMCYPSLRILEITKFEGINSGNWFPPFLELYINVELQDDDDVFDVIEGSGGWSDPRDKELCHNITLRKIRKVLLDMKVELKKL